MMKLMQKIMLTCKQATLFSSVKNFKKLKAVHRFQLKLHLMVCKACNEFDKQSEAIDKTLNNFHQNSKLQSEENLSSEKKSQINSTVNQRLK